MIFPRLFRYGAVLLAFAAITACVPVDDLAHRWKSALEKKPVTVTILHTNDFHSQLEPLSVPGEPEQGGAARMMTLVEGIRAEKGSGNVLLLSGGDNFQGTMFYNTWKGSAEIMVMNHLRYDAATLGNHEFDMGAVELGRALRGQPVEIAGNTYDTERARFIMLGTNVDISREPALKEMVTKRAILHKGGNVYGLLGVVTETVPSISSPGKNIKMLDYASSVQNQVDALKEAGVNKIILMSHVGYHEDVAVVPRLSGVDVIISGHDHAVLGDKAAIAAMGLPKQAAKVQGPYPTVVKDKDGNNVLVVSAMEKGRWLGQVEVTFDENGLIGRSDWKANPIFIRGCDYDQNGHADCSKETVKPEPDLAEKIAKYKKPIDAFANEVLGTATVDFGTRNDDPAVMPPFAQVEAAIMLDYAKQSDGAHVAVVNAGGVRNPLAKGEVTYGDVNTTLPFENTLAVVDVTGSELLEALDNGMTAAGGKSTGSVPHVAGITLHYCMKQPCINALRQPEGVVTEITIDGKPLDMSAHYRVATNNYMASGGDFYDAFKRACERPQGYCRDSGTLVKDVVADWLRVHKVVSPVAENRIAVDGK